MLAPILAVSLIAQGLKLAGIVMGLLPMSAPPSVGMGESFLLKPVMTGLSVTLLSPYLAVILNVQAQTPNGHV